MIAVGIFILNIKYLGSDDIKNSISFKTSSKNNDSDITKRLTSNSFIIDMGYNTIIKSMDKDYRIIDHSNSNSIMPSTLLQSGLKSTITPVTFYYNKEFEEKELVNNICIVDDERLIRKSSIRILDLYFKQKMENKAIVNIYELEDGFECLYCIYYLNLNGIKLDFIIIDETMKFMSGSMCSEILDKCSHNSIFQIDSIFILSAYELEFLKDKYSFIPSVKYVFNKPLTVGSIDTLLKLVADK